MYMHVPDFFSTFFIKKFTNKWTFEHFYFYKKDEKQKKRKSNEVPEKCNSNEKTWIWIPGKKSREMYSISYPMDRLCMHQV